jgi:hypothetical protein
MKPHPFYLMKRLVILASAFALAALPATHGNSLLPEQGRAIFRAHQDAVLPFTATISVTASAGGRSMPAREQIVHGTCTVLTEDGLMITALSSIDPAALMNGQKVTTANGKVDLNASTEIKELRIIMPDGLEIPAGLIMKDIDLDLGFFRPKAGNEDLKDVKFHPIDLQAAGPAEMLDEVLILGRLAKSFGFQPSGGISEVTAKIEKPRLCYRVAGAGPGTPVYMADGKLLGLTANRKPPADDSGDDGRRMTDLLVVLPAEDVARIAEQAKKIPAPKEDAAEGKAAEEPAAKDGAKPVKKEEPSGAAGEKPAGEKATEKPAAEDKK